MHVVDNSPFQSWVNAVQDMDKVIDRFQLYCFQAEERCHLYRQGDQLADVKQRFASVLDSLAEQPRVYAIKGSMPVYITYSMVKSVLFSAAYAPSVFPTIALVLDFLHRGLDLSALWRPIDISPLCEANPINLQMLDPGDGGTAVLCGDQRFRVSARSVSSESTKSRMPDLTVGPAEHNSSWAHCGAAENDRCIIFRRRRMLSFPRCRGRHPNHPKVFTIASRCVGWDIDRVDPPSMDWNKFPLKDRDPVNTSFPILFVSNTRDPITPMRSGLEQSRKFANAGFIEQRGEGHCSSSMVSLCTMSKIRAYLSKGVVPEPPRFDHANDAQGGLSGNWTTCEVDQRPWGVSGLHLHSDGKYSAEEVALLRAGAQLQRTFKDWAHFLPGHPPGFGRLFEMDENEAQELHATSMRQSMSDA